MLLFNVVRHFKLKKNFLRLEIYTPSSAREAFLFTLIRDDRLCGSSSSDESSLSSSSSSEH